ncbi:MAG: S53 family peptidase, partial [Solirubrobacteraceae bacterium]
MTTALRHTSRPLLAAPAALAATALALGMLASTSLGASPLPPSDYSVRAACSAPTPGHAACMALQLVPQTAEAQAHTHPLAVATQAAHPASSASEGVFGLTPGDLHTAYQLPDTAIGEQKIALVDAYNDPTAESDLKAYDYQLGLPQCTTANGCFKKVNQKGETTKLPFPRTTAELEAAAGSERAEEAEGWGGEISLDIETAHAVCESCKILLVEANSPSYENLESAEATAESLGATEISNSWGGPELGETPSSETKSAFNHPGTVITASTGDDGYLEWAAKQPSGYAEFPSTSPHVVAVGGTRLLLNSSGHTWKGESVWNDEGIKGGVKEGYGAGGGGCSTIFEAQPWQTGVADWSEVGCGAKRAAADVSADADPYTGVAVYYTSRECESEYQGEVVHWCTYGGTSLASPIIAATYALAGGANGVSYPARTPYENVTAHPSSLHDVVSGSNGECAKPFNNGTGVSGCTNSEEGANCSQKAICLARSGFDGPSGVGTPHGLAAFQLPATEPVATEQEILEKEEIER